MNFITKSDYDLFSYEYLRLDNGLEALLIHDPDTDKAAASLDVHVGSLSDPKEAQGLAHFLEHLLFMGTEKYPEEEEYTRFLSEHGGSSNAYTSSEDTNYFFDIASPHLKDGLDRFAQFFVAPLFDPSCTNREREAVDSEHKKNIGNDNWRLRQVIKHFADPAHPYHNFGTGYRETLLGESDGHIRNTLIEFYNKHYSAHLMKLVVYGADSIETMSQWVKEKFSSVPSRKIIKSDSGDNVNGTVASDQEKKLAYNPAEPFPKEQYGRRIWVKPLKDLKMLSFIWAVSDRHHQYRLKVYEYFSHLLGHEGPGSLLSLLKRKGWAVGINAGTSEHVTGFELFSIDISLTTAGVHHHEEIVKVVFDYLNMLRKEGPQSYIYEECKNLGQISFNFMEKAFPSDICSSKSIALQIYSPKDILIGPYLWEEFRPDLLHDALAELSSSRFFLLFSQNILPGIKFDQIEPWYGTEIAVETLSSEFLASLKKSSIDPVLHLPSLNLYIPKTYSIYGTKALKANLVPTRLIDSEKLQLWHKLDDSFLLPRAKVAVFIRNPGLSSTPLNYARACLAMELIEDSLNESLYAANLAGFSYRLSVRLDGLLVEVSGFNDKLPDLVLDIIRQLSQYTVDPNRFVDIKENYARKLANFDQEEPYQHATVYSELCLSFIGYSAAETLLAVNQVDIPRIQTFLQEILSMVCLDVFVSGNVREYEAKTLGENISNIFFDSVDSSSRKSLALPRSFSSRYRRIKLPLQDKFIFENSIDKVSSSIQFTFQLEPISDRRVGVLALLLAHIAADHFFDQLRTKEQLGYICSHRYREDEGSHSLVFLVQSSKHPAFLYRRIEVFLYETLLTALNTLSTEEFERNRQALSHQLTKKLTNLSQEFGAMFDIITKGSMDFKKKSIQNDVLLTLEKSDLLEFYDHYIIKRENRRKLVVAIVSSPKDRPTSKSVTVDAPTEDSVYDNDLTITSMDKLSTWKYQQELFPSSRKY